MSRLKIPLMAGQEAHIQRQGRVLQIVDTGAAAAVRLQAEFGSAQMSEDFGDCTKKFRLVANSTFSGFALTADVDCIVELLVSMQDVSVTDTDGSTVNANILGTVPVSVAAPLAVVPDRGAPGTPVYVSGITYADAPAVSLVDNAAVAVTDAGAVLVTANADRRGLRITNIGADPVTIGAPGITWAKRAIVLNSGDSWIEDRAANLAWSAICDATKTASVTAQEVIA